MESKDLNRLKVVLVEQKRTAKWLSEQIGKDPATVSKWCTKSSQPSLETLNRYVEIREGITMASCSLHSITIKFCYK